MARNNGLITSKQQRHLFLSEPYRFAISLDLKAKVRTILIDDYILLHT